MARIKWTHQAIEDVKSICDFIARDAPHIAQIFVQRIFKAVGRLEDFPQSGRIVPELQNEFVREIIFGNYRIVYRLKLNKVEIITVYHSARILDITNL